jgi:hypothetical protein
VNVTCDTSQCVPKLLITLMLRLGNYLRRKWVVSILKNIDICGLPIHVEAVKIHSLESEF